VKVTHLINSLSIGGAQVMLHKLLSSKECSGGDVEVLSLGNDGPMEERIAALGIPVRGLGMHRGVPDPGAVFRLAHWLRQRKPDVLQTWLYHSDLVGALAAKLAGDVPVVWNIRHSDLATQGEKRTTVWTVRACASLSRLLPRRIVCCSEASRRVHAALGYASKKMVVIPNGFDLDAFTPDPAARMSVRSELGIPPETVLIGLVGRFHPQKDHSTFLRAAVELHAQWPEAHFLLCGDEIRWENEELAGWIRAAAIETRCHLVGARYDIARINAALDIGCSSSSHGEGFPNVIGEAMACGVPCVVTDVGDSARIVGDTGRVVPAREPKALARACLELLELGRDGRRQLGLAARWRIETFYSLQAVAGQYGRLYETLAASTSR